MQCGCSVRCLSYQTNRSSTSNPLQSLAGLPLHQFARLIRGIRHIPHDQCHSPIHCNRCRTERLSSRCGRPNRLHRINTVDTIDLELNAPDDTTPMVGIFDRFVKSCSLVMTQVVESMECFEKATRDYQNVCDANRSGVGVVQRQSCRTAVAKCVWQRSLSELFQPMCR